MIDTDNPRFGPVDCPACDWSFEVLASDIDHVVECPDCYRLSKVEYDGGEPPCTSLTLLDPANQRDVEACIRWHEQRGC